MPQSKPPEYEPEQDPAGEEWLDALEEEACAPRLNGHARLFERREVKLGVDVHRVVHDLQAALSVDPLVFQRAHRLVTVVGATPHPRLKVAPGAPVIRELERDSVLPRLSKFVRVVRLKPASKLAALMATPPPEEWIECVTPPGYTGPLLACADWPDIPVIVGVTETPLLRPDGSILQERGYDEATGYLYAPSRDYPEVPASPSQDEAAAALQSLSHVFCDFPYVDPSHSMVPIAALLSVIARPAIDGPVPAFLFDASIRGSGKTLQADVVSLLATGRGAARAPFPEEDAELAKAFLSYALAGCSTVLIDNITRTFGGGILDAVLTARDDVQFRILGKNESPRLPWRTVILASGNNIALGEDTMRRVLVARLESPLENPEDRQGFAHPDLFAWVREYRPKLVWAALTVLRAYCAAGRPKTSAKRGSTFEAWSDLVPPAIVYAGGADPMLSRPTVESGVNDDLAAHAVILRELRRLTAHGDGMTAKEILHALYPAPRKDEPPDGWEEMRDAIETWVQTKPTMTPDTTRFGYRLRKAKGRVIGGLRLVGLSARAGVVRWRVQ